MGPNDEFDSHALKAHSRRDIEMLKREHALSVIQKESDLANSESKDKRKVWVVHGRNLKARAALFALLRAIGLDPMEWGDALALTGKGTPYTGEVLDHAFATAQAVVVLITGDDVARLGTRFAEPHDPPEETDPTPQARPNVLFEAGMAFGKYPDRTVLVHLGKTRPFSDVVGRNVLCISNDLKKRQGLADRLRTAGCDVKIENKTDWHTAGDFDGANEPPDMTTGPPGSSSNPERIAGSRLALRYGANPSIRSQDDVFGTTTLTVSNAEDRFENLCENIRARIHFQHLHEESEHFEKPAFFTVSGGSYIVGEPVQLTSLREEGSMELILFMTGPHSGGDRKFYSFSGWPLDPAREHVLKKGEWRLDLRVESDLGSDVAQASLSVKLGRSGIRLGFIPTTPQA